MPIMPARPGLGHWPVSALCGLFLTIFAEPADLTVNHSSVVVRMPQAVTLPVDVGQTAASGTVHNGDKLSSACWAPEIATREPFS